MYFEKQPALKGTGSFRFGYDQEGHGAVSTVPHNARMVGVLQTAATGEPELVQARNCTVSFVAVPKEICACAHCEQAYERSPDALLKAVKRIFLAGHELDAVCVPFSRFFSLLCTNSGPPRTAEDLSGRLSGLNLAAQIRVFSLLLRRTSCSDTQMVGSETATPRSLSSRARYSASVRSFFRSESVCVGGVRGGPSRRASGCTHPQVQPPGRAQLARAAGAAALLLGSERTSRKEALHSDANGLSLSAHVLQPADGAVGEALYAVERHPEEALALAGGFAV